MTAKWLDQRIAELAEDFKEKQLAAEREWTVRQLCPVQPEHVHLFKSEPWITYEVDSMEAALALVDAFPPPLEFSAIEDGCLYVEPEHDPRLVERGKLRWSGMRYRVRTERGRGFSSNSLVFWTLLGHQRVQVHVRMKCWLPWPIRWEVRYDAWGSCTTAEFSCPTLPGECARVKWAAGSSDSLHFEVFTDDRKKLELLLLPPKAAKE